MHARCAGFTPRDTLRHTMKGGPIFAADTFRFFEELGQNNRKPWMDENRERYKALIVERFRELLDRLAPVARALNPGFTISGRTGENFSRINRDIRFAADKSPYRTQMYLFFREPGGESGQLYAGLSTDAVTAGFRIYSDGKASPLMQLGRPRGMEHGPWLEQQKKRLGRKYESYWYSSEKGEWTRHDGWPLKPEEWKRLQAWVVRRKFPPAASTRARFERDVAKIFSDVFPLFQFSCSPAWKLPR